MFIKELNYTLNTDCIEFIEKITNPSIRVLCSNRTIVLDYPSEKIRDERYEFLSSILINTKKEFPSAQLNFDFLVDDGETDFKLAINAKPMGNVLWEFCNNGYRYLENKIENDNISNPYAVLDICNDYIISLLNDNGVDINNLIH